MGSDSSKGVKGNIVAVCKQVTSCEIVPTIDRYIKGTTEQYDKHVNGLIETYCPPQVTTSDEQVDINQTQVVVIGKVVPGTKVMVYCYIGMDVSSYNTECMQLLYKVKGIPSVVVDVPGYGESIGILSQYTSGKVIDEIVTMLTTQYNMPLEDIILTGHAMGCAVIARYAMINKWKTEILLLDPHNSREMPNELTEHLFEVVEFLRYVTCPVTSVLSQYYYDASTFGTPNKSSKILQLCSIAKDAFRESLFKGDILDDIFYEEEEEEYNAIKYD